MLLLEFKTCYTDAISQLYHQAISNIETGIYSDEQLAAWSKAPRSSRYWQQQLKQTQTWVLIDNNSVCAETDSDISSLMDSGKSLSRYRKQTQCVGFINCVTRFPERGYIEHLYIAPEYQSKGNAKRLYQQLELWAIENAYPELSTHASKLSKALFEKMGFSLVGKVYQQKSGQVILGYEMRKKLANSLVQ